jgi:hypothetical protein
MKIRPKLCGSITVITLLGFNIVQFMMNKIRHSEQDI